MRYPTTLPVNDLTSSENHARLKHAIDDPIAFVRRVKSCLLALGTCYEVDSTLTDYSYFLASAAPGQLDIDEHDRVMEVIEHEEVLYTFITCVLTQRTWMERGEGLEFKNIKVMPHIV